MQDIITKIVAEQAALLIVAFVTTSLGAAGTFAMAQLGRLLGERRTAILNEKLGSAISRATAEAVKAGLTGETAEAWIADYLRQTMAGTVAKLKATDAGIAKRISAQMAQDQLANALTRAGVPVLDAVRR
ncbi:hypothetical protein [Paracoccus laeviglucosivorans]|uniref:Bacteriophage holin of superfamily 6 (Holin_LLH) n=1 Tax=Paracoccus laeviglucosivorans TaxID=1197861 RepID=A0A521E3Q7_9RHOB|nr:hypothetical protein [Paracoccus laeviglucosivorans]SMO78579.1 hypothetical protein SAMN06265221_11135 [Paracoccus laeviglucosivorans]